MPRLTNFDCSNNRGTCDETRGFCKCTEQYYGDRCQFTKCKSQPGTMFRKSNPQTCSARGECIRRSGKCKCKSHFEGSGCEHRKCPESCTGKKNGKCNPQDGSCSCTAEYTGNTCALKRCPKDCNGKGTCDHASGKCVCHSGYSGSECVKDQPCSSVVVNWWDSFNRKGWSTCPSSTLLTGLYRNSKGCEVWTCVLLIHTFYLLKLDADGAGSLLCRDGSLFDTLRWQTREEYRQLLPP